MDSQGELASMPRAYETMLIVRPDISDEPLQQLLTEQESLLRENGATGLEITNRGKRRFAGFEMKKFKEGLYIQFNYEAEPRAVATWEKNLRINESILRYMTLRLD
ncbi:30S ribosomal protein S6 [Synechococcus sp. B60.2]|uniref:30S ribosomal protein S6 n=1 Tax=unclassified Synechococcus TaxID=2626047 RepID=UPI0039C1C776